MAGWLAGWLADENLIVYRILKFCNLASNAYFQCFGIDEGVPMDIGLDFGEIIITRLFSLACFLEAIVFFVDPCY